MKLPDEIQQFVDLFSALPGIGPRQAVRLAFYFIYKGPQYQELMSTHLQSLKNIKFCRRCFFVHANTGELCDICRNQERDVRSIAILEKETDVISLERSQAFHGRYMVIGSSKRAGALDDFQKGRLSSLKTQIKELQGGMADEIIIAVNPTTAGDITVSFVAEEMRPYAHHITKLGRGIPTGGEIEFADAMTLKEALTRRK
ncbi:MAG: toprim domain-containing protein [bacterium]